MTCARFYSENIKLNKSPINLYFKFIFKSVRLYHGKVQPKAKENIPADPKTPSRSKLRTAT